MLAAGMPYYVATFYREVHLLSYATHFTTSPEECSEPKAHWPIAVRVAHQAAIILASAIGHPWLTAPTRRLRVRRLRRILENGMPERTRMRAKNQHSLHEWERYPARQPRDYREPRGLGGERLQRPYRPPTRRERDHPERYRRQLHRLPQVSELGCLDVPAADLLSEHGLFDNGREPVAARPDDPVPAHTGRDGILNVIGSPVERADGG